MKDYSTYNGEKTVNKQKSENMFTIVFPVRWFVNRFEI